MSSRYSHQCMLPWCSAICCALSDGNVECISSARPKQQHNPDANIVTSCRDRCSAQQYNKRQHRGRVCGRCGTSHTGRPQPITHAQRSRRRRCAAGTSHRDSAAGENRLRRRCFVMHPLPTAKLWTKFVWKYILETSQDSARVPRLI